MNFGPYRARGTDGEPLCPSGVSTRVAARCAASVASLAAALLASAPAHAQVDAGSVAKSEGEIVVTGTRISGFAAPTPVTSFNEEQLKEQAVRNVADLLLDIPAFKANQNIGTTTTPIGASNLDLRGLGPARTLVLLDGRRLAATAPTGDIDVNTIPAILIKRIEIVTGGASAAYGSDAVSGVVNLFLDNKFTGIRGDVQYGETKYGDIRQPGASLAWGSAFGDRGHIVLAAEYSENSGQLSQATRDWGSRNYGVLTNPNFNPANGEPRQLILPGAVYSQMTPGGVTAVNSIPALRGIQFGPGGTVQPFTYGQYVGNSFMIGGSGGPNGEAGNILPRLRRGSAYGRVSYDLNDNLSIYADALYARGKVFSDLNPNFDAGNLTIRIDNAYLPSSIRQILVANNRTSFNIGRQNNEDGQSEVHVDTEVQRYGAGIEGSFGENWTWDGYVQVSRNNYSIDTTNIRVQSRWLAAVDAVVNPATGQVVCRSTLTDPTNGCIPANVFGAGSISQAAVNYYNGTSTLDSRQKQEVVALNLRGKPFSTWAGPVSVAVGAEYRREAVSAVSDPLSQAKAFRSGNPQGLSGSFNVKEAYAEIVIPLADDVPFARLLDVNLAGRITDYSSSGTVTTYKVGVNYSPFTDLRLRGTLSRDIRAANVNELYSGQTQVLSILLDPFTNTSRQTAVITGGNPDLAPERARSYVIGGVYQPSWLPGAQISVDYYSVNISDAITALPGVQVLDGCFRLNVQNLCDAITRDPTTNIISQVSTTLINVANVKTNGIDIEAAYNFALGNGRVTARALVTYVNKLSTTIVSDTTDFAGQVGVNGGVPHWRGNLSLTYRTDKFHVGALVRYVQGGTYSNVFVEGVDINDNSVPGQTYLDLTGSYRITPGIELFGKIDNVLNRDPPVTVNSALAPLVANSPFYDRIGRFYSAGVRFRF
jgi:iron complex outermembrane receptor protein